jgi:hypothetical protein
MLDRQHDVSRLTAGELERIRRDLRISLTLIIPSCWPARPSWRNSTLSTPNLPSEPPADRTNGELSYGLVGGRSRLRGQPNRTYAAHVGSSRS